VKLDDPLGKYLTDYPNKEVATKVTVQHLLTHMGVTGDFFGPEFDEHRLELKTAEDYVKLFGARPPKFEPGTNWEYSNYGFLLLGMIVEKASGQPYYDYVREHNEAISRIDFITEREEIVSEYAPGEVVDVRQHDGTILRLRSLHADYDPTNRAAAMAYMQHHHERGEVVTGLLYVDPLASDLHTSLNTTGKPLNELGAMDLCPGGAALEKINASLR
jgi:hypothetical protein